MWGSIAAFLAAGIIVLVAGLAVVGVMSKKSEAAVSAPKSENIQSPPNQALQKDARLSLDRSVTSAIRSLQVDDDITRGLFLGMNSAEIGLYDSELRAIVENMHSYLEELRNFRG